jgi:hypothetical protein
MSLSRKNDEELKIVVVCTVIWDGLDFARSVDVHSIHSWEWWEKKERIERKKEKRDEENRIWNKLYYVKVICVLQK